jgi:signal transduction histidine kinase
MMNTDLEKVVVEIVSNAFKFSTAQTPVEVRSRVHNQHWRITVRDQGRGMTPKQISQIGAYMQFDRRLYEQQGLGLGLSLSRRLVELYGGELHIHSVHEQETTVTMDVPLHMNASAG